MGEEGAAQEGASDDAVAVTLSDERFAQLAAEEEFILTVTVKGYGKRTSSHEYRVSGRGGSGIANIDVTERNGPVIASLPVAHQDQMMLVTDGGQLIRIPVDDIRIAGRKTQGVTLFKVEGSERVMSVTRLITDDGAAAAGAPPPGAVDGDNGG